MGGAALWMLETGRFADAVAVAEVKEARSDNRADVAACPARRV